ncbi:MAG: hypothetical protein ACOC95_03140 [Planctomycetota bacterium]
MGVSPTNSEGSAALVAVLTGDIVGSSQVKRTDGSLPVDRLRHVADAIREAWPDALAADVDVFSGDSWQMLLARPALGLRVAVFVRASLIGLGEGMDTRLAIGIGTMSDAPFERVSQADGEAFRLSGRALETMSQAKGKDAARMRLKMSADHDAFGWDAGAQLLDAIIRNLWTAPRAVAVAGAIRGWNQETISAQWPEGPIAQASVSRHLRRAAWGAVEASTRLFEAGWTHQCSGGMNRQK